MTEFGNNNIVCMNSMHQTNKNDFNPMTMMVIDDSAEPQRRPVEFILCNKEDEHALGVLSIM